MPAARGITPLPARESGKGPGAAARLPWGAGCPRGWRRPLRPRGGGGVWPGGLRPPGLPNKKLRPEAKPPVSAFQGASRPAAAPLGDRNAIRLAPETWRMRQEKGGRPLRRPPVMAVSPISPLWECCPWPAAMPAHPAGSPPCRPGRRPAVRPDPCASSSKLGSARRAGWYAPGP